MDNMGTKHIILFLAGAAVGAFAWEQRRRYMLNAANTTRGAVKAALAAEAMKGLSSWH